jgi:hypothetical protein
MLFRLAHTRYTPASLASIPRSARHIHATAYRATSAGYGDPQDEKAENKTPLPSSTPDPKPKGQGKGPGSTSGSTDPEVRQKTGNAGGDGGNRSASTPNEKQVKETKKIGEEPKKEEVGGAGPIGG